MVVSDFTTSLSAIGSGAAAAMTRSASFVSSAPRSTASTGVRWTSATPPSTDCSQRLTLRTISSWVSPSKESEAMAQRLPEAPPREEVTAQGGGPADQRSRRLPRDEVPAVPQEEGPHHPVEHGRRHPVEVGVEHVVRGAVEDEGRRVGVAGQEGPLA